MKNTFALLLGLVATFFIGEIFLRIYNPFKFRVKGDEIILPINQSYTFKSNSNKKLDSVIVHTKNSLGFRGADIPSNFDNILSIIAVGGSTTECFYLSDNFDWPNQLGKKFSQIKSDTWINNAGLDGHSTFGHIILLQDYISKIKPKYILYLIGNNDIGRDDLGEFDRYKIHTRFTSIKDYLIKKSEIIGLIQNLYRVILANRKGVMHREINFSEVEHVKIDNNLLNEKVLSHKPYLDSFRNRLLYLIRKTKELGSQPILITQPSLLGKGVDPTTNINLETINLMDDNGGKTYWEILERYNDVTRELSVTEDIVLVDLAKLLPKDSKYYYDGIHFSNEGSEFVSNILFNVLQDKLF